MCAMSFVEVDIALSNGVNANVILHDLDLNFQG